MENRMCKGEKLTADSAVITAKYAKKQLFVVQILVIKLGLELELLVFHGDHTF
jgi:hypothetical protein